MAGEYEQLRERIIQECRIEDWAGKLGFTVQTKGRYGKIKESDSCVIYLDTNSFCRFSSGVAGNVIDFLVEYGGMDAKEAFKTLAQSIGGISNISRPINKDFKQKPVEKPAFVLPPKAPNMKNVFAYLTKTRGIDAYIVKAAVKRNMIYQDDKANCVFVGWKDGAAKFACKKSSNTKYKYAGDVGGSDGSLCWPIDNGGNKLVVAESPIDIMSVMTKLGKEGKNLKEYDFLGLSGVPKIPAIKTYLHRHEQIDKVILCMDKDKAGITATYKAIKMLRDDGFTGDIIYAFPKRKDYNDDIRHLPYNEEDMAYKVNEDSIPNNAWLNPYVAETLHSVDIPIGYIINNCDYIQDGDRRESWFIPTRDINGEENPVKLFKKGIVAVVNPKKYSESLKPAIEILDKAFQSELLENVNEHIKSQNGQISLEGIRSYTEQLIKNKTISIVDKLKQYDNQLNVNKKKRVMEKTTVYDKSH